MLLRHAGERGICIDHFAALIVEGDAYRVLSLPGRPGSVLEDGGYSSTRGGAPGIWIKDVERSEDSDGENKHIITRLVQPSGLLSDILRQAVNIVEDTRLEACRLANPL